MSESMVFDGGLTSELIKRAEIELGETEEVKIKALHQIKCLIETEPEFSPYMEEVFIMGFLRIRKFRVHEAFDLLKRYYTFKAHNWGTISGFKPSDFKDLLETSIGVFLESRDRNNSIVGILKLGLMDLHAFSAERYYASCVNIVEVLNSIEASQIAGNVIIFDLEGLSFSTMMHLAQPYFLKLWKSIFRDCIPYRMTGMHYINDPEYFNIFLKIARQLFRKKLQERIFVHGNDLTSLHKYVSPEILPEEYGGKQGSWTECSNTFLSKYFTYDDYIDNLNKYGYTGETLKNLRQKSAEPIQDDSADLSVRL